MVKKFQHHFEVERELAARLKVAPKAERGQLYKALYDELFQRVPEHPQLQGARDARFQKRTVQRKLRLVSRFCIRKRCLWKSGLEIARCQLPRLNK